jgi:hypothetical protein
MKSIRKQLKPISLFMSFLMLFASCSQHDDNLGVDNSISKYTGKDLYKSVFFAYGDFASKIDTYNGNVSSLENLSTTQKTEFEQSVSNLMKSIELSNPNFFNDFKKAISSKNHLKIENAIKDGGEQLYNHLEVLYPNFDKVIDKVKEDYESGKIITDGKIDKRKLEFNSDEYLSLLNENMITSKSNKAMACSWVLVCVAYFVLAVHNQVALTFNVAAAATVAVAVAIKVKIKVDKIDDSEDELAFEILVNDIATIE